MLLALTSSFAFYMRLSAAFLFVLTRQFIENLKGGRRAFEAFYGCLLETFTSSFVFAREEGIEIRL